MVSVFEILSNEVIMELFDYLDAYQLFKTFFNLNSRFNQLLKDHRLCLTFNSKHVRQNEIINVKICLVMIKYLRAITLVKNKHIRMLMPIFKENDLTFLQSVTIYRVRLHAAKSAVLKFIVTLKSLRKLHIQALGEIQDLILMIICRNELPELKSFQCTSLDCETSIFSNWPTPTNIENLTVDCILSSFDNLLLQIPKLKYLNIRLTHYGTEESILSDSSLPIMMNLIYLKMNIFFISYDDLSYIVKSMPNLQNIKLTGSSSGENFDNGHQLKQLLGHLPKVQLIDLRCITVASSPDVILATFNDNINGFWSNVTCSLGFRNQAHISAIGRA